MSAKTVPAPLLFCAGAVSQYAGAAVAVMLFSAVPPAGVAWLRVVAAAVVMAVWRRPWRDGWAPLRPPEAASEPVRGREPALAAPPRASERGWLPPRIGLLVAFGGALAAMNLAFYLAVDHLPLGTAVAIEFLGPVMVAAAGTRSRRDLAAFAVAVAGVALLTDVTLRSGPDARMGIAFALCAAVLWAAYIILGHRVASQGRGVDGLATGLAVGAVLIAPVAAPPALAALADPRLLIACLGVGVLSSVLPYALDQVVLRRVEPGRFALLLCLLPATAAVVGAVVLGQIPSPAEATGIGLVAVAVAVRSR